MLFYRAALPLSSRTLNYTAGIIRRHLKAIGLHIALGESRCSALSEPVCRWWVGRSSAAG
jgi:hypothetical protein